MLRFNAVTLRDLKEKPLTESKMGVIIRTTTKERSEKHAERTEIPYNLQKLRS